MATKVHAGGPVPPSHQAQQLGSNDSRHHAARRCSTRARHLRRAATLQHRSPAPGVGAWCSRPSNANPGNRSTRHASRALSSGAGGDIIDVLALDVEYLHLAPARAVRGGRVRILPAEVCLAAADGSIILQEFCHPGQDALEDSCFTGGVPEALWREAPPLPQVVARVRQAVAGRRLIGHGLAKDLAALGIDHPGRQRVDTVGCAAFQGPGGQARSLAWLAANMLGRTIQAERHSAREDALTVMELWQCFAKRDTSVMDAAALEAHYLEGMLSRARAQAAEA